MSQTLVPLPNPKSKSQEEPGPSHVVHFRNVREPIIQQDILVLCQGYGKVRNILMLASKNQAFVEFEDVRDATRLINNSNDSRLIIQDITVYVSYSIHQTIENKSEKRAEFPPSRVLLVTISNPIYNVTVDILSQIFSPFEMNKEKQVEKIILFQRRTGLQALVQFSNVSSATNAMKELEGKNIYNSCCRLQIQYSKQNDLKVSKNSDTSYDYTRPGLDYSESSSSSSSSSYSASGSSSFASSYGGSNARRGDGGRRGGRGRDNSYSSSGPMDRSRNSFQSRGKSGSSSSSYSRPGQSSSSYGRRYGASRSVPVRTDSPVVIVTNFPPDKIGCDQLFNLYSNVGIVVRIKIMKDKRDSALIQFQNSTMAANAIQYLSSVRVCGKVIYTNKSVLYSVNPIPETKFSEDSNEESEQLTPSGGIASSDGRTVEYEASVLNRYEKFKPGARQFLTEPTEYVYVSNLAPGCTEGDLRDIFNNISPPTGIRMFSKDNKTMAVVMMPSAEEAVESVCFLHNRMLKGRPIRISLTRSRLN